MAVAVAKLDVLESPMKQKRIRKNNVMKASIGQSSDEIGKRKALKSCLKTVEVAKNQLSKDLLVQLKKQYKVDLGSYEAHSLKFLKIPETKGMDIWFMVEHPKKYYVVVKQMMKENLENNEYYESLKNARNQISQLIELLKLTAMLITGKDASTKGFPKLPDELKIESSRSKRQNRDCLFVKEYQKLLDTMEEVLKNYQ